MVAHVLAVLGLAVYGFEVYRTVNRFGVRRSGLIGGLAGNTGAHVLVGVLTTIFALILDASFAAIPVYVAPAAAGINAVYVILALRHGRRRSRERKAQSGQ